MKIKYSTLEKMAARFMGENATNKQIDDRVKEFAWLIRVGYENAIYGYDIRHIVNCAMAEDYIARYSEAVTAVLKSLAKIGWALCTEDEDCVNEAIEVAWFEIKSYNQRKIK